MTEHIRKLNYQETLKAACSWFEQNYGKVNINEVADKFCVDVDELSEEYRSRHGESNGTVR